MFIVMSLILQGEYLQNLLITWHIKYFYSVDDDEDNNKYQCKKQTYFHYNAENVEFFLMH